MALNFPATPEEGDLYTAEGVTYVWRTNRWVKVSDEELDPVEIVEADMTAKWQVWGDVLIQWGYAQSDASGNGTITAPQSFKDAGVAHWTATAVSSLLFSAQIVSGLATENSARFATARIDTQVGAACEIYWIAIGEAPDALKKPKVVHEGASGGDLVPVEIVEADMSAKWQVWGDTLVQWGFVVTNSGGNASITFPKAFKASPVLALTPDSGTSFRLTTQTSQLLVNSANVVVSENGTFGAFTVRWLAIGEAPDALKKPKVVQTIGGSELQEYHDPAGVKSWRIVGTTLECWGLLPAGTVSVTFPKRFQRVPTITANNSTGSTTGLAPGTFVHVHQPTPEGAALRSYAGDTGAQNNGYAVLYHAIGEWDGVS